MTCRRTGESPWSRAPAAGSAPRPSERWPPPASRSSPRPGGSSAARRWPSEVGGRALRLDVTDPDSVAELAEALPERLASWSTTPAARSASSRSPRPTRSKWRGDVRDERDGRDAGDQGAAARARAQAATASSSSSAPSPGSRSTRGAAATRPRSTPPTPSTADAAAGAARQADPGQRGGAGDGRDGVLAGPLRRRPGEGRRGLRGDRRRSTAEDVADAIAYVVTRPPHVDIDYVSIKPTDQATARDVHRE